MQYEQIPTGRRKGPAVALLGALLSAVGCQSAAVWREARPADDFALAAATPGPQRPATDYPEPGRDTKVGPVPAGEDVRPAANAERDADRPAKTDAPAQAPPRELPPPPVVPPPVAEKPIDLPTALEAAGVDNPTIALAEEAVRASQAEQLQAQALLLPSLHAGTDIDLHRGNLLSARGVIRDVHRQSLYVGAGAAAVGAGTVGFPGVQLTAHVADAVFEPRAAREAVVGRQFDAVATRNDVLLDVTDRYFALAGAEASLRAVRLTEDEEQQLVQLTANFARTGQGREGDAQRARADALLLHTAEEQAEEGLAVAAAELARLLDLDPSVRLQTPDGSLPLVEFFGPHEDVERLVQIALANRPEVGARTADIEAAATRLREERWRPLLPLLAVGFSAGDFGGGSDQADTRFGHVDPRTDFDALAVWSLRNFGAGDWAVQRERAALVGAATAERLRVIDQIGREVAEAYALSETRRRDLEVARRRAEKAEESFRLDLERARNPPLGPPVETLDSLRQLAEARQQYIRAAVEFDQAQFRLFVALGRPPTLAGVGDPTCPSAARTPAAGGRPGP
jgi:outer membrane protein TolC